MSRVLIKSLFWGVSVALYLRFGLEPTGWLFYQASFALHVDALYLGYQGFRGGHYLLEQSALLTPVCIVAGGIVALLVQWRVSRKEKS